MSDGRNTEAEPGPEETGSDETHEFVDKTETRASDDDDDFPGVDAIIGTFMSEASLWPVLIVALGSGGALGAAMLILAGVDRNPFAAGALLLVGGMTVDVGLRARREEHSRNIAKLVGFVWLSAFALAGVAIWTGIAFG